MEDDKIPTSVCSTYDEDPCGEPKGQCMNCGFMGREHSESAVRVAYSKSLVQELRQKHPKAQVEKFLARKPYSSHPDDRYLSVTLRINEKGEYVTHLFNSSDGGYSLGHYHGGDFTAALADFNQRGAA